MIEDFHKSTLILLRRTNTVLEEQAPAASMTPTLQPASASYLEVVLEDLEASGSVGIEGSLSGAVVGETPSAGVGTSTIRTEQKYDQLTVIRGPGLVGGTISVRAVGASGEPVCALVRDLTLNGRIRSQTGRLRYLQAGAQVIADYQGSVMWQAEITEGRIIEDVVTGTRYEILFVSAKGELGNVLLDLHLIT